MTYEFTPEEIAEHRRQESEARALTPDQRKLILQLESEFKRAEHSLEELKNTSYLLEDKTLYRVLENAIELLVALPLVDEFLEKAEAIHVVERQDQNRAAAARRIARKNEANHVA